MSIHCRPALFDESANTAQAAFVADCFAASQIVLDTFSTCILIPTQSAGRGKKLLRHVVMESEQIRTRTLIIFAEQKR